MNPSPFPGMDPWLELHSGDVHHRQLDYTLDLDPRLRAEDSTWAQELLRIRPGN